MTHSNHFPAFETNSDDKTQSSPLVTLVRRLSEAVGPSGSEELVRSLIRDECKSHADQLRTDDLGNLIIFKRGTGGGQRRKLMLSAHMDEVGLIITHLDQKGFLRFSSLGPTDNQALYGQRVVFGNHTAGVIGQEEKNRKGELEYERLYIDVGEADLSRMPVGVGDSAAIWGPFVDAGTRVIGKALDDRVGCAILIQVLTTLKKCPNDVYFVFTVQQQVGARGAATASFGIQPDFALAVDVTGTGDTPEAELMQVALGKGPAIKVKDPGVLVNPAVRDLLVAAAREAGVAYQLEVGLHGASETGALQIAREGAHAAGLSVPLRYMHTPSEMADLGDVQAAIKMLIALLAKPFNMISS